MHEPPPQMPLARIDKAGSIDPRADMIWRKWIFNDWRENTKIGYGVISCGSAVTLKATDSGKTILLDTATGSVVTLPAPAVGIKYKFIVSASVTSNNHIIGGSVGEFLLGCINMIIDTSATSEGQVLNGSTHLTLTMNGSTTGGLLGTALEFEGLNSTQWGVSGTVVGSGTLATPATV